MIRRFAQALILAAALGSTVGSSQDPSPAIRVREVADSLLRDVAVAVADPLDPVIYYNPRLMERFGPNLSAFVLAHEYGHISYGHRRVPARISDRAAIMRQFELEADCYAARMLASAKPGAALVAIEFFVKMGEFRYDEEHPTGTERAEQISSCFRDGASTLAVHSALSAGLGRQVIASLRRLPGEPGPMAMLKSSAKPGLRKAARRTLKPEADVRRRTWEEF